MRVCPILLAAALLACGADDPRPDAGAQPDAGAPDAALDAGPEAWECACEGNEDCAACIENIGNCCYEDPTIQGQAERLAGTCARTGACSTCCDECAAKSCEELVAAGACPPQQVAPWDNGLSLYNGTLGDLAAAALSTEALQANEAFVGLLDDPGFHKFVKYIIECALPEDASVHLGDEDLQGGIGLAPEWAEGPCETACQEWVSACMLARSNAYGVTVKLYLSSQNAAMIDDVGEVDDKALFPEQEGAYYGNMFIEPPVEYACRGEGRDPLLGTFRVCAQPGSRCGIQQVAACGPIDGDTGEASSRHACEGFDPVNRTYTLCHDRATAPGSDAFPADTRTYERIFTTWVAHTAFQEGYADECPSGDGIVPFAPEDVRGAAGALCDNDEDCDHEAGLHCDARPVRGICSAPCQDSADPGAEQAACGEEATCAAVVLGGEGNCTASCTPRERGGDCETGQVCTTGWLGRDTRDDPGCRPFCSSDADCGLQQPCNRFGACGFLVDPTALADGEPCSFPEGSDYPDVLCRGACIRLDDDPSRGHCASLINMAVTDDCPDDPTMVTLTGGDDLAICAYKRCAVDEDCTAPFVCVDTARGHLCDYPPAR